MPHWWHTDLELWRTHPGGSLARVPREGTSVSSEEVAR